MKKQLWFFTFLVSWNFSVSQNIAINTTGSTAATGSGLDIDFTNKGLLIPRVSLASNADLMGNGSLPTSLIVYKKDVVGWAAAIGFYYWDGSVWTPLTGGSSGWLLLGNSGTTDGTHFLGTSDNKPLNFRVSNQKAGRIDHPAAATHNTAFGYQAANAMNGGTTNSAFGVVALFSNTTGAGNTAAGNGALFTNVSGGNNAAFGQQALYLNTGDNNAAFGFAAIYNNAGGGFNTAAGNYSLYNNVAGSQGTAIGVYSQFNANNQAGAWTNSNVSVGYQSLYGSATPSDNTGNSNTAIGYQTLLGVTSGSGNIGIGYKTGDAITSGQGNIVIGYDIDAPSATGNRQLSIGNLIFGTTLDGTGTTVSTGKIGIATNAPNTTFDVNGSVAWREGTALSLANGNNNNITLGNSSFYRITGPTSTYTITGLTGGADGRILTLYNTTTQALIFANDATGSSTAANCIYTLTGANFSTAPGPGVVTLQYNANVSRWLVVSRQDKTTNNFGGGGPSPIFPDGLTGATPVILQNGASAWSYNVTAGKNLYITNYYSPVSVGNILTVGGTIIISGYADYDNGGNANATYLQLPIIAGGGTTVAGPGSSIATGFEVPAGVTPVTQTNLLTTPYTVTAGKTLVIFQTYITSNLNMQISVNGGINYYDIRGVNSNISTTHTGNASDPGPHPLNSPLVFPAGTMIKMDSDNFTFNGYEF